jgi:type VI secretion system secreted protein Hcp
MKAMRISLVVLIPVTLLLALLVPTEKVEAATFGQTMFLALDGVPGESQVEGFENTIEIGSYSWGVTAGNPPSFSNFSVVKLVDRASPKLLVRAAKGTVIPGGRLSVIKAGGEQVEYLTYCFSQLRVKSVKGVGEDGAPDSLQESVAFSYRAIVERYRQQSPAGGVLAPIFGGWDTSQDREVDQC